VIRTIAVYLRVRDEAKLIPWTLANLGFADRIFVLDTGSTDGTWSVLQGIAERDRRLCLGRWPEERPHFFGEPSQLRHVFQMSQAERFDWHLYLDADEVPNLDMQGWLSSWLAKGCARCDKLGVEFRFLYLCPGWEAYYVEPSRWPILRCWNYVPEVSTDERGDAVFEQPEARLQAPEEMILCHWNWALEARFARKRPLYEARFGQKSWHPDEKYPERAALPEGCLWFAPTGDVVGPEQMRDSGLS
jgi:glycosyltransferase involved in cell wall biosynthesis